MPKQTVTPHALKMAKGRKLRLKKAFADAAAAYGEAARMLPRSRAGLFAAMSLRDAGSVEQAEAAYQAYLAVNDTDAEGWTSFGTFLKNTGRLEDAIQPLRKALNFRDDTEVRNTLIGVLWRAGRVQEAEQEGHHNIRLKDTKALADFKASAHRNHRLHSGGATFDPSQRTRNIIAFSLWGDRPEYITGAIVNAQIAQHIYVCWTPRFYCDATVPKDAIHALRAYGAQVVMMDKAEHQKFRPMWRFLVSDDPNVNIFICRDADSRLNAKELLAVNAWIESGKRFHVMRDHIYHHELILAGMWGGTAGVLPNISALLGGGTKYFDNKFGDQAFLADFVWPLIRSDALIHDTYFRYPNAEKFPPGYDLPGAIHVGGGVKSMPHWSQYVHLPI